MRPARAEKNGCVRRGVLLALLGGMLICLAIALLPIETRTRLVALVGALVFVVLLTLEWRGGRRRSR